MSEKLQVAELAAAGTSCFCFFVVAVVMTVKKIYRSCSSKSAISGDDTKMTPLLWPRLVLLICSMIWTGAQLLRLGVLWDPGGLFGLSQSSQKSLCRMYIFVAYGSFGPCVAILLFVLLKIALRSNDVKATSLGTIMRTVPFLIPVVITQAFLAYIDTIDDIWSMKGNIDNSLPSYFFDVYTEVWDFTDETKEPECWDTFKPCVACTIPLLSTAIAAIAIFIYAIALIVICTKLYSTVINVNIRSRIRNAKITIFIGLCSALVTGGTSVLFRSGTFIHEAIMLGHIFSVVVSCLAAEWFLIPSIAMDALSISCCGPWTDSEEGMEDNDEL